jgi:hypothetical protein
MKSQQISKGDFENALRELGHDPDDYKGKKLSLRGIQSLYGLKEDTLISAIDDKQISAHYDYLNDIIWVDALDAAHFYYCVIEENKWAKL